MARPRKLNEFRIDGDVVWIKLTQGKETCVDLADWPEVREHTWFAEKAEHGWYVRSGTVALLKTGRKYLHKFLLSEGGKETDHRDRDGLNNCRYNLRLASPQQNSSNRGKRKDGVTSRFKGVCWDKQRKRFIAQLGREGRTLNLGRFESEEEAARAYDAAVVKFNGEFARANFQN